MAENLEELATGFMASQALHVLGELGVAELMKDGPARASDLARATGCHGPSLERLLRALATLGVVAEDGPGCFHLTSTGTRLTRDHPASVVAKVLDACAPHVQAAWLELGHAVRTGRSAFEYAHGIDYWGYLARRPELATTRCEALAKLLADHASAVSAACDFSTVETIVDVGGGSVALVDAILARNGRAKRIRFDAADPGAAARTSVRGEFADELPREVDVYLLANVIGDRGDPDAIRILRACRAAAGSTSRLLVIEAVAAPALADLEKMVLFGEARERTADELRALVEAAGFEASRVVSTGSGATIVEARPV